MLFIKCWCFSLTFFLGWCSFLVFLLCWWCFPAGDFLCWWFFFACLYRLCFCSADNVSLLVFFSGAFYLLVLSAAAADDDDDDDDLVVMLLCPSWNIQKRSKTLVCLTVPLANVLLAKALFLAHLNLRKRCAHASRAHANIFTILRCRHAFRHRAVHFLQISSLKALEHFAKVARNFCIPLSQLTSATARFTRFTSLPFRPSQALDYGKTLRFAWFLSVLRTHVWSSLISLTECLNFPYTGCLTFKLPSTKAITPAYQMVRGDWVSGEVTVYLTRTISLERILIFGKVFSLFATFKWKWLK